MLADADLLVKYKDHSDISLPEVIQKEATEMINRFGPQNYVANLGHGILPGTPEENARVFFEAGKNVNELIKVSS